LEAFTSAFANSRGNKKPIATKYIGGKAIDAYKEACDAAGAIASAATIDDVAAEREAFKRLYWGVMCVIEHENVESAMKAFYPTAQEMRRTTSATTFIVDSVRLRSRSRM